MRSGGICAPIKIGIGRNVTCQKHGSERKIGNGATNKGSDEFISPSDPIIAVGEKRMTRYSFLALPGRRGLTRIAGKAWAN